MLTIAKIAKINPQTVLVKFHLQKIKFYLQFTVKESNVCEFGISAKDCNEKIKVSCYFAKF